MASVRFLLALTAPSLGTLARFSHVRTRSRTLRDNQIPPELPSRTDSDEAAYVA